MRTWHGWYQHITLVAATHAFLVGCRQRVLKKPLPLPDRPVTVTVSMADLRRWLGFITLLDHFLTETVCSIGFRWRRRHQHHRKIIFIGGGDGVLCNVLSFPHDFNVRFLQL